MEEALETIFISQPIFLINLFGDSPTKIGGMVEALETIFISQPIMNVFILFYFIYSKDLNEGVFLKERKLKPNNHDSEWLKKSRKCSKNTPRHVRNRI